MTFAEWINSKFEEWEKKSGGRRSYVEFSRFLEVSQPTFIRWKNGDSQPGNIQDVAKLARKLDIGIYDVLGLPTPSSVDLLSPEVKSLIGVALAEINEIYASRHISPDSPEAVDIATSILSKHGFSIQSIKA